MTANMQMVWQASHAYALTAVVIPTTFVVGSHTWRCTTAGTSGATEPTWPDPYLGTDTITDGAVTWTQGTAVRQWYQTAILAVVTPFAAANPTLIRAVRSVKPRSLTTAESPCFWIGEMTETITHANGIRTRTFSGLTCIWADQMGEQIESNDRANFAADVLTDLFTANFHAAGGATGLQHIGTRDVDISEAVGGGQYIALEFSFAPNTAVAEGRS